MQIGRLGAGIGGLGRVSSIFHPRPLWQPNLTDIPGLLFWFDTTDVSTMTLDGVNNIEAFRPQIGDPALYTIRQTTPSLRPFNAAAPSGKNIVRFTTATNQLLEDQDVPVDFSQGCSLIFAWMASNISINRGLCNVRPLTQNFRFDFSVRAIEGLTMRYGDPAVTQDRPIASSQWYITSTRDEENWLNGGDPLIFPQPPLTTTGSTHLQYGRSALISSSFAGDLGHFMFIEGPISDNILRRCEGFVAWDLGIQASLVAGHPWKNQPPIQ
jgi:hypothetical protein